MADIRLDKLGKRFPNGFEAVKDLSLEIGQEEFLVLVGPSGCGKSTVLRMIAGLEDISSGDLYIGGGESTTCSPQRSRHRDGVPELRALPAHDGAQNMAFGLQDARRAEEEIRERVPRWPKLLGLERSARPAPGAALGRPASARRDGTGDRPRAPGRSSWTSRCRTSTPSSACTCGPSSRLLQKRLGSDDGLRHPRPGRGDDAGQTGVARPPRRASSSSSTRRPSCYRHPATSSSPRSSVPRP